MVREEYSAAAIALGRLMFLVETMPLNDPLNLSEAEQKIQVEDMAELRKAWGELDACLTLMH